MACKTNAEKMRDKNDRVRRRDAIRIDALRLIAQSCTGEAQQIARDALAAEAANAGIPGNPTGRRGYDAAAATF